MDSRPDGTGRGQGLRAGFFVEPRFLLPRLAVGFDGGGFLCRARLVDVGVGSGTADSADLTGVQTSLLLA